MNTLKSVFVTAALAAATVASAGEPPKTTTARPPAERAEINFVNYGGIRDWRAERNDALLIRSLDNRYYRATFFGPCIGLDFATRIGFVSDVMGSLDKFGSILVDGHECYFRTFTQIEKPEKW